MSIPVHTRQSGFTLVEMLVSLFILALVAVAGSALLMGATTSGKQVSSREAELRALDLTQTFLRNDISTMVNRASAPDRGYGDPETLIGDARSDDGVILSFIRDGWANPGNLEMRSSLQKVRYVLTDGTLTREATLRPDGADSTPRISRTLLEGVEDITLTFERGGQASDVWFGSTVPPANVLPDMIEVELTLTNGRALTIASLVGGRS